MADIGFVSITPKVATRVSEIDFMVLKYLFETKTSLEGLACELASERITEEEIVRLESIVEELKGIHGNSPEAFEHYHDKDSEFHSICHLASRNPFIVKFLAELEVLPTHWTTGWQK